MTSLLAPLPLTPLFFEKVWGGRALERLGKRLPARAQIGESWELADMPSTSGSGAGGGAARTTIASGPLAGRSLNEANDATNGAVLGGATRSADGAFPLLIKFLDARENLSVQVHPSPAYAREHAECKLKTECWYILDASPGAVIYKGLVPGTTPADLAAAIAANTVESLMVRVPAIPGECHNLPSGTVHALGAGVLIAEVQTPSDTTFRLYDWGRAGRALHVHEALACVDFGPPPSAARADKRSVRSRLVTTEFFTLDEARLATDTRETVARDGRCTALLCIEGEGEIRAANNAFATHALRMGDAVLIPSAIADASILAAPRGARVLLAGVGGDA